jgi:hypothetical protein
VHALRSRERGCFLVVQTLWAEKIQSTTDAGSLNTFGRNEIEVAPISSALLRIACLVILYKTCQPRARRLAEIVRFNAQDAREFSDPLVRDAIASVFIAADLPRRYVGGVGKLAHCHPAMLTVFLQALSDV